VAAILVVAVFCGVLSVVFSVLSNCISSLKKSNSIEDKSEDKTEASSTSENSGSLDKTKKNIRIDPKNPHATTATPIDVVALDGTDEVV